MGRTQMKEFMPTILFLAKFVGIYIVGNFFYGLYVTSYEPLPDPVTHSVTTQTAVVLNVCGWATSTEDKHTKPTTNLNYNGRRVLAVYEGCNGLNVMIIFVAFIFAFGPINRSLLWYIPMGLLVIHAVNLMRITLLFFVSIHYPSYMYFMHKYFFTAILYIVVFVLWIWWVRKLTVIKTAAV